MPFKEMLKTSPISRYTVFTSNFNHSLPWRLDTCIQTLQIQNFSLYVESLGSHARILTYFFRFNIPWNAENCGIVFYETWPGEPVSAQNFISAFLWISAQFYRTSQFFMLFVKGMKHIYTFFVQDSPALVGKNCCSLGQGPLRFKASTSCWAILGCCCPPLTYPMLQPQAGYAKELGFIPFFPLPSWMLGSGRKVAVCLCQHRAPYTKGIFCYVRVAKLESLYTVQAMYPRDNITKVSLRCCCDPLLPVLTHHPSLWGSPICFGQESKPGTCGPRYLLFCSVWNTLARPSAILLHTDTQKSTPLRCVKIALPYIALL